MNKKITFFTTLFFLNICLLSAQQTWEPDTKLTAEYRTASDFFGCSVDIEGDYAIVGAYQDDEDADEANPLNNAGSAYIYKKEGNSWVQKQKLVPAERYANDNFGRQVAISGDYAIIASEDRFTGGNFSGAVYVFKREGEEWVEKQKLTAPIRGNHWFGYANNTTSRNSRVIDIEGDYIVIGSKFAVGNEGDAVRAGAAYVFKRDSGNDNWVLQQKILASDRAANDWFGASVGISDNRIIVGAPYEDHDADGTVESFMSTAGSIYIFKLEGDSWEQEQKIVPLYRNVNDQFGHAVSISGNYAVAGAAGNDTDSEEDTDSFLNASGAAYVFYYNGTNWVQQQKIVANDRGAEDMFGFNVDIDSDRLVVGVPYQKEENEENPIEDAGSVYIFKRNGTEWTQEQRIVAENRNTQAYFGVSIAIVNDNSLIFVGAPNESFDANGENEVTQAGAAYIFGLVCLEITAPEVETHDAVCAGNSITLTAVSEGNTINWYDDTDSTEILHTGSAYTIENLTETTTYWVEAVTAEGCVSERISVIAAANPLPELTVLTPTAETCEGSPATLEATVAEEEHLVVWYDSPDATEWIETGAEFITPVLTETTSYWVQAYNPETHCVSERTEIVVTVLPSPVLNLETPEPEVCYGHEAELFAASTGNVIFWYANEDDEEYLYHGNLFITEELTETTTYWVEAYNILTGCSSERIEVTVTVNSIPDAPIAVSYQTVEEGTTLADLDVEADGILTWYANEALTVVLPETTWVEENTIYYVTQTVAGCESAAIEISIGFLGLADINGNSFSVYPNPTAGVVKIQSKVSVANIEVFNMNGQLVTSVKSASEVNISGYTSGTYVLRIILENGEVVVRKVIKR